MQAKRTGKQAEAVTMSCFSAHQPHVLSNSIWTKLTMSFILGNVAHWRVLPGHLSKIVRTDESSFQAFGHRGQQRIWRHPGDRYTSKFVVPTVKHGGSSLLVWGMMTRFGVGPIYGVDGSMWQDQYLHVLENALLPHVKNKVGSNFSFQQDNAPCHASSLVKEWFQSNDMTPWSWPPQSPDLSPIENLWRDISMGLKQSKPINLHELLSEIQRIWYAIPVERCQWLVDSFPRRIKACISSLGSHTKC